jgi:hypothetical protein
VVTTLLAAFSWANARVGMNSKASQMILFMALRFGMYAITTKWGKLSLGQSRL